MQVNHLAPALLSVLLLPSLKRGGPSRIVNVNSIVHAIGFVDTSDLNFLTKKTKFSNIRAYSSSKLAQVMFFSVLQKLLPIDSGINLVCIDPGAVRTDVVKDLPRILQHGVHMTPFFLFSPREGSRFGYKCLEYCGKLKAKEWPACAYIGYNCKPTSPSKEAHNVWRETLEMVGLPSDAVEILLEGKGISCRYDAQPK